jgi:hypothetical protein
MKVSLIKALGDAHFFFRRKIGLFPLRAIPQSCIIHQYFIFCHFPLTFKTTALRDCSISQFQCATLLKLGSHKKTAAGFPWQRIEILFI